MRRSGAIFLRLFIQFIILNAEKKGTYIRVICFQLFKYCIPQTQIDREIIIIIVIDNFYN